MPTLRDRIRGVLDIGIGPDTPPTEARHVRATNLVALGGAFAIGSWVPQVIAAGHLVSIVENTLCTIGYLSVLLFSRAGRHTAAVSLTLGLALFQVSWSTVLFGVGSASSLFFLVLVAVPYLMFHRPQRGLAHAYAVAAAVLGALSVVLADHLPMRLQLGDPEVQTVFNTVVAAGLLVVAAAGFAGIVDRSEDALKAEHARAERLLLNVLPPSIAQRLQEEPDAPIADRFDAVTVLFADIVGFTPLSARVPAERTVALLNEVFGRFDAICDAHGVEKIKTIGDGYMAVAGAPEPRADHAVALARVAIEMRDYMATDPTGEGLRVRIGLNTGPAIGAIVGTARFHYDLWSDAVNVAARMESTGEPGRIHVTEATWEQIRDAVPCEARGTVTVKGKGEMATWFVV